MSSREFRAGLYNNARLCFVLSAASGRHAEHARRSVTRSVRSAAEPSVSPRLTVRPTACTSRRRASIRPPSPCASSSATSRCSSRRCAISIERQSQLCSSPSTRVITRYEPPEFQAVVDDDVVDAAAALAATFETASRGVIYEHRPADAGRRAAGGGNPHDARRGRTRGRIRVRARRGRRAAPRRADGPRPRRRQRRATRVPTSSCSIACCRSVTNRRRPEPRRPKTDAAALDTALTRPVYLVVPSRYPREQAMAKSCEICGKTPVVGRQVSHAHNVSARRFEPNLQTVRAMINGGVRRIRVCTRCLRSHKVVKAA